MGKKNIKVLMLAAEITPIAKVGGLGDVLGSLPPALVKLGCDARVMLPLYGLVDRRKYKLKKIITGLELTASAITVNIWSSVLPGKNVRLYWLEAAKYFGDKKIYEPSFSPHADSERFIFFSSAALAILPKLGFTPDIIHCHDSHTALAPCLLKIKENHPGIKTILTIHNLYHQGKARPRILKVAGLKPDSYRTLAQDAADGDVNLMAQGVLNADIINTVSPAYAREILRPEFGAGLEALLDQRKKDLYGILNGIDTVFFDPVTDELIAKKYSSNNLSDKISNKIALQKKLGLPVDKNKAVVGIVSRLVWQKGLDLISEKIVKLLNCYIVILGTGEKKVEKKLIHLAKEYPGKIKVVIKFDEALAHLIYAGSDMFLMPSRFEPCGLGQMIAMRYGTVPVVHTVGGLKDTVHGGNGFSFDQLSSEELHKTLQKALMIYYEQPEVWRQLQLNGMKEDFSWGRSAKEYLKLYIKLLTN